MTVKDPIGHTGKTVIFRIIKGKESSFGTAGSLILDIAALFLMAGILIYTSLYRKRGRQDDKMFFALIVSNAVLAAANAASCLLEGSSVPIAGVLMAAANIIFYALLVFFPYLFFLYLDYRVCPDDNRFKKMKTPAGIPCFLFFILLMANQITGWIYSIRDDNIIVFGHLYNLILVPLLFYFIIAMARLYKINGRLVLIGLLLIASRAAWGGWFQGVSSTAFTYTLILVCTFIHVMNRSVTEEKP